MSQDLWRWSATQIVSATRANETSCREVVQAHLDRIEAVNPHVNALTVILADAALAKADLSDALPRSEAHLRPLHGLPITIKENIDVAGTATTYGVASYKDNIAMQDAPVVQHLIAAGAIVIGRSNMPDFGLRWHTDNALHGATQNPWNPSRTPGGSSGGEAAALATGMSALGIGNDMGGSTRQPAINCGVFGLRPTTGRVSSHMSMLSDYPPSYYEQIAAVNGPMARSVADLRLVLSVMQRPDPTDPTWTQGAAPPCAPGREHHIGLVRDSSGQGVDPGVTFALDTAVHSLRAAGYTVEDIDPSLFARSTDIVDAFFTNEASDLEGTINQLSPDTAQVVRSAIKPSSRSLTEYLLAISNRHRLSTECSKLMHHYPLILGPVSTLEPFEVGYDLEGASAMRRLVQSFQLTEFCNLIGLPSVAVPVCLANSVPQGVQIIGRPFDEDRCFSAAERIKDESPLETPIDPKPAA